ncbi:MAG: NADH-quinone oxidoreductase subunit M [Deltaproteobacteria bacterium]|nr:NADH-quinone oxidoreductase subunit M [Deltaproteobacteria bacterium]
MKTLGTIAALLLLTSTASAQDPAGAPAEPAAPAAPDAPAQPAAAPAEPPPAQPAAAPAAAPGEGAAPSDGAPARVARGRIHFANEQHIEVDDAGGSGTFTVENIGRGPLRIQRVAIREGAPEGLKVEQVVVENGEQRLVPPTELTLSARRVGSDGSVVPGGTQLYRVTWRPTSGAREVYSHVVVETDDPEQPRGAMGVTSSTTNPLNRNLLSLITFAPALGGLLILFLFLAGHQDDRWPKWIAGIFTAIPLVLSVYLLTQFDPSWGRADGNEGFQFVEHATWIRSLHVEYYMGVDGVSIAMVILTSLISFIGVFASAAIEKQQKGYYAMYLLLATGMFGTFVALDFFLFFVFWEVMLLPMYFLIGIWGGPRKEYAAIKFFLYTLGGSVLMLLAIIALYLNAGDAFLLDGTHVTRTFSMTEMMRLDYESKQLTILGLSLTKCVWVGLFIGFAIKIPMFPFHTWLPDAHVEAPTAISVILAGVLLKMGTYGIIRMNYSILPEATQWAAPAMAAFGVINILYGAFCAMAQEDLKKLVAYSSINHMGYCLLGMAALTPQGLMGCAVQMFNHGTITAMLFMLVGVVYDRVHTRDISKFGGMAQEMPLYTAFVGLAFFASLGLPGLSGFIGEIAVFMGAFPAFRELTIIAATGVIIGAAFHLWALQRVFLGGFRESWRHNKYLEPYGGKFPEINRREIGALVPLAIIVVFLGFYPSPLIRLMEQSYEDVRVMVVGERGAGAVAERPEPPPTVARADVQGHR